jgi:hypothetical protein
MGAVFDGFKQRQIFADTFSAAGAATRSESMEAALRMETLIPDESRCVALITVHLRSSLVQILLDERKNAQPGMNGDAR